MSSQSQRTSTTDIPREQHAALFAVINKVRMLNGWQTRTAQELDATIRTWAEVFNKHRIPVEHYNEIYLHAFDTRQRKIQHGIQPGEFDATLMVASWGAVAGDIEQRRIEERRYLPATAASDCPRCFGSGMEIVKGEGRYQSARPCNHEPIEEK